MAVNGVLNFFEYSDHRLRSCLSGYVENNNVEAIKLAVRNRVSVNVADNAGVTPLHIAAKSNDRLQCMKELLKSESVNIDVKTFSGDTPVAFSCKTDSNRVLKVLIQHGADLNLSNCDKETPLHIACSKGCLKTVILLIEAGADVNVKDLSEWTPLHEAAKSGSAEVCKYLLEHDADATAHGYYIPFPLHIACQQGDLEVIRVLENFMKKKKANLNPFNMISNGETPVMPAVTSSSVEVVKYLIDNGADVNIPNNHDLLPLHIAAHQKNCGVYDLIRRNTKRYSLLKYCTFPGPNSNNTATRSIVCLAVDTGHMPLIERVLKSALPSDVLNCPTVISRRDFFANSTENGMGGSDESHVDKLVLFTPICFFLYSYCSYGDNALAILKMLIDNKVYLGCTFNSSDSLYVTGPMEVMLWSCHPQFDTFQIINVCLENGVDPDEGSTDIPTKPMRVVLTTNFDQSIFMLLVKASNVVEPEDVLRWIIENRDKEFIQLHVTQDIVYALLVVSPYATVSSSAYNFFMSLSCNCAEENVSEKIKLIYERSVRSLANYCRSVVRQQLHYETMDNRRQFAIKLNSLHVPKTVISYLKFNEIKFIVNTSMETVNCHVACDI